MTGVGGGAGPLAGRLALGVLSLVVALALGEGACRLFPAPASQLSRLIRFVDDARGYVLRPGAEMEFVGVHEPISPPVVWRVNSQGIRADREVAREPSGLRVLTYGDSEVFGWSVNLEDTFQKGIERRVSGSEVLNLGVPGYNAPEVALHVETTAAALRPGLLVYLINPNDFEPAMMRVDEVWLRSELVRWVLFTYVMRVVEERNLNQRRSDPQLDAFRDGMRRVVGLCRRLELDCVAAFLDAADIPVLRGDPELARYFFDAVPERIHDVSSIKASFEDLDRHMSADAHRALAEALAAVVRPRRQGAAE